ncbi:MAG: stage III sporulation protein AB [Lachnospiraceae bacterium]
MKGLGAGCLLLGAAGFGWQMAFLWKQRLELLLSLRQLIYFLKGEILYSHATLAEGLASAGKKGKGPFGALFAEAARRLNLRDGVPFSRIWREEGEKLKDLPLTREDWEQFFLLGSNLGYLDLAMQERTILLYLEQLDETIKYLKEHSRERSRLYMSLGIMGGLFFTIALF